MDVIENKGNSEGNLSNNEKIICKNQEPDLQLTEDSGYIETKDDDSSFVIGQEENSSDDYYGEEEWLSGEENQNNTVNNQPPEADSPLGALGTCQGAQPPKGSSRKKFLPSGIEENQQEVRSVKSKKGCEAKKNITFEDKTMSKADMFVCNLCHRIFINKYKLGSHLYNVHKVRTTTKTRKIKESKRRKELPEENWIPDVQRLAKRVNNIKIFICDQCPYTVMRCDSMTKHVMRVHSKGLVKPQYMCEVCGKTFIDRAYLRNHGLSHMKEPQFFCEVCGRRFHRQPSLKRHIQSHSDEKQFSCSLCEYKTHRKHLMYNHAENHRTGKAYTCKVCLAKFFTQMSLRKHNYTQHSTRYACSFCKIAFSSRERLWCHMQKIHFACEVKDCNAENLQPQDETKVEYIEVKLEPKSLLI